MKTKYIEYTKNIQGEEKKFNLVIKDKEPFYEIKCLTKENQEMGFITFEFFSGYVWIYKLETKKSFRNQGVASALIDLMEYISMENHINKVKGNFFPTNKYARPFYENRGYFVPNKTKSWDDCDETWTISKTLDYRKIKTEIGPYIKEITKDDSISK